VVLSAASDPEIEHLDVAAPFRECAEVPIARVIAPGCECALERYARGRRAAETGANRETAPQRDLDALQPCTSNGGSDEWLALLQLTAEVCILVRVRVCISDLN
jgi:hypothetical protein